MINVFHPSILFCSAAIIGNLPYLLWALGFPEPVNYEFEKSYYPLVLWFVALLSFIIGTQVIRIFLKADLRRNDVSDSFLITHFRLNVLALFLICSQIIQLANAIALYGVVPLFSFFGGYEIEYVNVAQELSGFGQFGLLTITNFGLSAIVMLYVISPHRMRTYDLVVLVLCLVVILFATLFQGKRQGLLIFSFSLMFVCVSVGGHPFNPILLKLRIRPLNAAQTVFTFIALAILFITFFGLIGYLRVGEIQAFSIANTLTEMITYLSLPLINTEGQIAFTGIFETQFDFFSAFSGLIPFKLAEELGLLDNIAPRLERSVGAGLVGTMHWNWGLEGLFIYCLLLGASMKYFFTTSRRRLFSLLTYSQSCWALFAAHSYNHFLALTFFPLPIMVYFILCKLAKKR